MEKRRINTGLSVVIPIKDYSGQINYNNTSVVLTDPVGNEVPINRLDYTAGDIHNIAFTIAAESQNLPGYYSVAITFVDDLSNQRIVDMENFLELTEHTTNYCESTIIELEPITPPADMCCAVWYGSSANIPSIVDGSILEDDAEQLEMLHSASFAITTSASDKDKCHFVCWPKDHTITIQAWNDAEGDSIKSSVQYVDICHYRVAYILSNAYIVNTSNIVIGNE